MRTAVCDTDRSPFYLSTPLYIYSALCVYHTAKKRWKSRSINEHYHTLQIGLAFFGATTLRETEQQTARLAQVLALFGREGFSHGLRIATNNESAAPEHPTFALARTSVRARGGRAPDSPCLYPCPRTHGEIPGRNAPGRRARDSHTNRK